VVPSSGIFTGYTYPKSVLKLVHLEIFNSHNSMEILAVFYTWFKEVEKNTE
jgi:hypothetical protein